ncbi:hypothetical protein F2Q69_00020081 [Brassica cretica]|uniref:Uncharacterized protein n=1 Tax=Brassica cretica TaxID=69181 RepID=A0A8S9Q6X0_BRACR|nr:hypothetical protein F2Q69_00020081 [Brassica cretica]
MKSLHQVALLPERVPHLAPALCFISSYCARVDEVAPPGRSASRAGASPRSERSLRLSASFLHIVCGLLRSLPLPAPASKFVDQDAPLRVGAEHHCGMSRCLRFVWSGCRRSLPLPALVLYSLKQHLPLSFLIPNASKYLQELQWTLQHLIKTYAMQKGN